MSKTIGRNKRNQISALLSDEAFAAFVSLQSSLNKSGSGVLNHLLIIQKIKQYAPDEQRIMAKQLAIFGQIHDQLKRLAPADTKGRQLQERLLDELIINRNAIFVRNGKKP